MTKFLPLSETSDWNSNMIFINYSFLQIDDTDAMEDVHSLLTDAPPPSGIVKNVFFLIYKMTK